MLRKGVLTSMILRSGRTIRGLPSTVSVLRRRSITALRTICEKSVPVNNEKKGMRREGKTHRKARERQLLTPIVLERVGNLDFEFGVVMERVDDLAEEFEEGVQIHDTVLDTVRHGESA